MKIGFDPAKRDWTLRERGLDFLEAELVFGGPVHHVEDLRFDYRESRIVTFGFLDARMIVVVWTARGDVHHIISMRKANAREIESFGPKIR